MANYSLLQLHFCNLPRSLTDEEELFQKQVAELISEPFSLHEDSIRSVERIRSDLGDVSALVTFRTWASRSLVLAQKEKLDSLLILEVAQDEKEKAAEREFKLQLDFDIKEELDNFREMKEAKTDEENNEGKALKKLAVHDIKPFEFDLNLVKNEETEIGEFETTDQKHKKDTNKPSDFEQTGTEKSVTCEDCNKTFMQKSKLHRHWLNHHRCFTCNNCSFTANRKTQLKNHIYRVHIKPIQAKKSLYRPLSLAHSLRDGWASQKEANKLKKKKCPQCGRRFRLKFTLDGHLRTHTGELPFPCLQCGRKFRLYSNLHVHQTTVHEKKKPYACDLCDKSYGHKKLLRSHHLRVHLGQRELFRCPECRKSFGDKSNLRRHHRNIHLKEKPIQCPDCEKKFSDLSHLKMHKDSVHDKLKTYICAVCGKGYAARGDLKKHEMSAHKKRKK